MTRLVRSTTEAFADFAAALNAEGLRAALGLLAEQTDFRFVGIWRFHGDYSAAAAHYDRQNPMVERIEAVPAAATYCSIVREQELPFLTNYAVLDERLLLHPAREAVASYCGVPVVIGGEVAGTLCHYDFEPRDTSGVDTQLMLMVAAYLAAGGHVPAFPH